MLAVAAISAVEALEAIEVLVGIETVVAITDVAAMSVKTVTAISSVKDVQKTETNFNYQREAQNKTVLYNTQEIGDEQWNLVMNERVIEVERMCESKWQYFPSGILTPFTWALFGQALRHEFVIIHTENHICLVESKKTDQQALNLAGKYQLKMSIYPCKKQRNELRTQLLKDRFCDRQLASETIKHILYLKQINSFINLMSMILLQIPDGKLPTIMEKIDKQFARAIFYFSKPEVDFSILLQTIFGVYTDKPLYIPRFDMILIEKAVWNISKQFKLPEQALKSLVNSIQVILNDNTVVAIN